MKASDNLAILALVGSGKGEMFGCSFQRLPFSPKELLKCGYSIVHDVKNIGYLDEPALYDFFSAHSA